MYDLSILIPALREEFLSLTVEDILKNKRGKTEIIVGLDGAWSEPAIVDHPDVRIVYSSKNLGQRGMTNTLARLSKAKYVAKVDAHCAFDEGFDVKLMEAMQGHDDWTVVPVMRNMHIFNWKCLDCGDETYQGPEPEGCKNCDVNTPDRFEKKIIWNPKTSPQSSAYKFTPSRLQFKYFGSLKKQQTGDIAETMSLQGSFFMLTRDKYWELGICDESWGGWGQQGTEVALKTWLSGGTVMCVKNTWYAHMFRTQHGFAFPWGNPARQQQKAREVSTNMFLKNQWDKQKRPLSWLVERFWAPLQQEPDKEDDPKWTEDDLARVKSTEERFQIPVTDGNTTKGIISGSPDGNPVVPNSDTLTPPILGSLDTLTHETDSSTTLPPSNKMPSDTVGLSTVNGADGVSAPEILGIQDKPEMVGIATTGSIANNMVKNGDIAAPTSLQGANEPRPSEPVSQLNASLVSEVAVADSISGTNPNPATSGRVYDNLREESINKNSAGVINNEHTRIIPQKSIIYYTDNQLNTKIARKVQANIRSIGLPITSASLKPMSNMGTNVVVDGTRGYLTMFKQILAALEASTCDIVFFCEHDNLYHQSHFDFTPERKDMFYYDLNWFKVRDDGFAVHWDAAQVSGLCCYRDFAIEYYKKRIAEFDPDNFDRKFEPAKDNGYETWVAEYPSIDIRHNRNLTYNKWRLEHFRDRSTAVNFQQSTIDQIPGWDNLQELLQ